MRKWLIPLLIILTYHFLKSAEFTCRSISSLFIIIDRFFLVEDILFHGWKFYTLMCLYLLLKQEWFRIDDFCLY